MQRGFSLVELSIVLVILGLLTGGILAGQSLIRAAEIRTIATGFDKYTAAVNTFRDKYMGIPGDITNAVKFWGAQTGSLADGYDAACGALDHTTPSTTTATCNGNGDGRVGSGATGSYERFRSPQQLANAGLIEGSYTGVNGAGGVNQVVPGQNGVAGRITNTAYIMVDYGSWTGNHVNYYNGDYINSMLYGGATAGSPTDPALKPEEAWNLDTKMDDGRPGLGVIRSFPSSHASGVNCASTAIATTAEYRLDQPAVGCVVFRLTR